MKISKQILLLTLSLFLLIANQVSAQRIITFSDLTTNPIRKTTNNTTFNMGIALSQAPSSSVTVSFASSLGKFTTSSSLTFTTSNWATAQTLTITGVNDGVVDIVLIDTLTITATNGGYSGVTKMMNVTVYDNVSFPYDLLFGYDQWSNNAHVINSEDKRLEGLNFALNGNGLPSGYSNLSVSAGFTGAMHVVNTSALTDDASVDRYTVTWLDDDAATWTHYTYHIKAITGGNAKLMILSIGNLTTDTYDIDLAINTFNAAGIDVLLVSGPVSGNNTENSSVVTSTSSTGWNQMISGGLDTPTYSPLELFLFDICGSLNYIDDNYSYTSYSTTGIHAGAWVALVYGALDPRIDNVFPIRGLNPLPFDNAFGPYPIGDNAATNGTKTFNFYRDNVSLLDYMIICAKQKYIKMLDHTGDGSSSYATIRYWSYFINNNFDCTINYYVSTNPATAGVAFYSDFLTEIINEL